MGSWTTAYYITLMEDTSLKNSSMYRSFSSLTGGGGGGDPVSMSPPCDGLLGASKPCEYAKGILDTIAQVSR